MSISSIKKWCKRTINKLLLGKKLTVELASIILGFSQPPRGVSIQSMLLNYIYGIKLDIIGLSLSSACNADCIFCPPDRAKGIKQKVMPFDYAEKIVNEISSKNFKKYHNIRTITMSENGEALLNNDLLRILRHIKSKLPHAETIFFTNFSKLTKDKAEAMLKERLIDGVFCNIDGFDDLNYFNVKKLELKDTKYNLINFLKMRKKLNHTLPLTILVLTLHDYIHTIYKSFGFYPSKLRDRHLIEVADDFLSIKEEYEKILNPQTDRVIRSGVVGWAEREGINTKKIDYNKYSCTKLRIIKKGAYIAPDGTWYACCLDSNNQLDLGNVIKGSIIEVSFGKKRRELIRLLESRQFAEIGEPCKTVNCCQWLPSSEGEGRGL